MGSGVRPPERNEGSQGEGQRGGPPFRAGLHLKDTDKRPGICQEVPAILGNAATNKRA